MGWARAIAAAVGAASALSGCGGHPLTAAPAPPVVTPAGKATDSSTPHHLATAHHRSRSDHSTVSNLLAVHDPGTVTGTITAPCHTHDHGQLPDRSCTPGAVDPAVTQTNIDSTICRPEYTDSVRPPESQTEAFKWDVAEPAYGQRDVSGELDHLVPLELGGDNDARNLWVEAGSIPNPKDAIENALNHAVCHGQIPLRRAQQEIARNWIKAATALGITLAQPSTSSPPVPAATRSAWCTAMASYNSQYADWDIHIQSNQPDATATASSGSYSHTWRTDSNGYADVYLRGPSRGQTIAVSAGSARCSTSAR